ncbi:type 1 phosphatases regulator ypi1 [Aspergillus heteromorphus CBS 117.55]|uniref:Type 1 phosphatases regulator n=1 Tax=Aspergillus heteromorphus CBS 117.55 TaxID=1448321 RepID=A0A317URR8_9EURO|nr:type 1 phosphatases regulator ypi1 [Aspergillus heteromorphus CBS 117.55]PWY64713.1 type 1 phosphatases regulator ypi1 [Aspergillus heteromorphus CBS 117.55]
MSRTRRISPNTASSSQVESAVEQYVISSTDRAPATLRLRAENEPASRGIDQGENTPQRIRWSEDVIDNEGLGRKSSKVCCIYHKSRTIGDSTSESESSDSSTSGSDSDSDNEVACKRREGDHKPLDQCNSHADQGPGHASRRGRASCDTNHHGGRAKRRKPSPNAYEKMPKTTNARA